MKIIEAFPFFNELNMLTYRLNVLNDVVDLFVIVEGTLTHSGKEKPLYYKENEHLFEKYKHKIVHYVDTTMPFPDANSDANKVWQNEFHQRNVIMYPLQDLNLADDDVVAVTDLDEIVNPDLYREIRNGNVKIDRTYHLHQHVYYYNLNARHTVDWNRAFISNKRVLDIDRCAWWTLSGIRHELQYFPIIWYAGWHLSFFGDIEFVRNKLQVYAHQEHNTAENTDPDVISHRMETLKEPFVRGQEHANFGLRHLDIKDNNYLPPMYETYLQGFYTASSTL